MAFLTKGLRISLTDLRDEEPKERVFHYMKAVSKGVRSVFKSQ